MSPQTCTLNGTGLERVRYFTRQLITADDMLAEQQYFRQKLRRHNRFLHGWGVVCGMRVTAAPDAKKKMPWRVKIDAGYALGPYGDEIYLAEPYCFDLATCQELVPDPCEPGEPPKPIRPKSGKLYVAIRYVECESRPVRVHPLGCACEETLCEYSRIRDDFEIGCLPEPPELKLPLLCDLLGRKELAPCPPCPDSGWIVLAEVTLPEPVTAAGAPAEAMPELKDDDIDNSVRRQLFSTALLQEQLIDCCCEPPPPPVNAADLELTMTGAVDQRSVIYKIQVTNHGPSKAKNVRVEDKPPPNMSDAGDFATNKGAWTKKPPALPPFVAQLGDLAVGATAVVLSFKMTVPRDGGRFKNTATVMSDTPDPISTNNSKTLTHDFEPLIR